MLFSQFPIGLFHPLVLQFYRIERDLLASKDMNRRDGDCFVTESQRKGEVGDTNASNKHTEMER